MSYNRKCIIEISEVENILKSIVLSNIKIDKKDNRRTVVIKGEEIYVLSDRYKLFFSKGYKCVNCGIEGSYFALEKDRNASRYHINLYAKDKNNKEILMTKDHIIPKSLGGKNNLDNYQTMCCNCNLLKANKI